jgi:hypothetical protein
MMHSIAFNDDSYHINKDVDGDFVLVEPVATPADPIAALSEGLKDGDDDEDNSYDYCDDVFEQPMSVNVQIGSDVSLQPVEEDDNVSYLEPQAMDEDEEEVLMEMAMSSSIMNQLSHEMDELPDHIDHDATPSDIAAVKEGESVDGADSKSTVAEESGATESGVHVSNVSKMKPPNETEINNAMQITKNTGGSRLTNKKRRKQLKLSKKAAAAAAAAAALAKISTRPVSPIRRNKKITPTGLLQQQQQRKALHPQVACAAQEIANFREGMTMQNNTTKMVR